MMLGPVKITQYYTEGPLKGERADNLDIGFWSVGRTEELRQSDDQDNETYTYEWMVTSTKKDGTTKQYSGTVQHRYGNGWIFLLAMVFAAAAAEEALDKVGAREINLEIVPPGPDS